LRSFLLLAAMFLTACGKIEPQLTRLSSTPNSASTLSATWSESSAGATTSFVYRLHLHENQTSPILSIENEILRTSSIVDTELVWNTDKTLQINCLREDVFFWINRSYIRGQNIRIELNSSCSNEVSDQWTYLPPSTPVEQIDKLIANDSRVQNMLANNKKALPSHIGLRVLHNKQKTKEVIEIRQD
jgi:hypothetical protein